MLDTSRNTQNVVAVVFFFLNDDAKTVLVHVYPPATLEFSGLQ